MEAQQPEPELVVMDGIDPYTVEVVNKYSGLGGTSLAVESLDETHAAAWLEKVPPAAGEDRFE